MANATLAELPRQYTPHDIEWILSAYRTLFPEHEMTPALRSYWGLDRKRPWSYLTTDFHRVKPDALYALHERSQTLADRNLDKVEQGEALRQAARELDVGFSIGVCPWTDNLLFETFDPAKPRRDLVVLVGHDWYPIGDSLPLESPIWKQGLHHVPKYRRWCPRSFFGQEKNAPVIFFLNLYPDFRKPGAPKTGLLSERHGYYPYSACMDGLREVLRILRPKFERSSVISWGAPVWAAIRGLVDGGGYRHNLMQQQTHGDLLSIAGTRYLPMAHPSFGKNHHKPYLRRLYQELGLGLAEFDLAQGLYRR